MKRLIRIKTALFLFIGLVALSSCAIEKSELYPQQKTESVTFKINVPANNNPRTRALSQGDEYAVSDISVLGFDKTTKKFKGRYAGRIVSGPTHISGASATVTFEVSLPKGDLDIMIVANAASILNSCAALTVDTPQATIEEALKMSMSTSGWNSTTGSPTLMPMWGYAKNVNVPGNFPLSTIFLTRMVAKVDVQLGGTLVNAGVPTGDFLLQEVYVYNYVEQGRLIPYTDGSFEWAGMTQSALANYQTPSLPSDYTKADSDTKWLNYNVASPHQSLKNEIYLFEAPLGVKAEAGSDAFLNNTCLVIGGSYDGHSTSYYRIDFARRTDEGAVTTYTFLPILRNNSYTVTITGVSGDGHGRPEDALQSAPTNITANILDWNNENITTIATDGVYMLGVSQGSFEFSSDARTTYSADNALTIVTNNSGGWSATVWADETGTTALPNGSSGQPWLRLTSASGNGNYPNGNDIKLLADPNNSGDDRTAFVHIKAGTLNYIVKVVQRYRYIKITDIITGEELTSLSFSSKTSTIGTAPTPRQVKVEWSPASETVYVTKTAGSPDLEWQTSYSDVLTGGAYVLTIDPAGITQTEVDGDPFISKTAELGFQLGTTSTTGSLAIRQTHYALNTSNFTAITTSVLTGTGSVKSNAPWSCTWTSNLTSGSMTSPTTQPQTNAGSTAGVSFPYSFTSGSDGYVTFTFSSTDPTKQFDPVSVRVDAVLLPVVPEFTSIGTMIHANQSYVGAFWRANEKGERLIRIPASRGASVVGNWAVQVYDYGDDFVEGDIVFSTDATTDTGVIWDSATKKWDSGKTQTHTNPDEGGFYVTGGDTYAMGKAESTSDYIEFRVGLTSTHTPTPTKPARYATIVISYGSGNYNYHQKLYLRQGEGDDYVMYTGDAEANGAAFAGGRPDARKWSPYNLTAASWASIGGNTTEEFVQINKRTATGFPAFYEDGTTYGTDEPDFAAYPTMAGAHFQWAQAAATTTGLQWQRRAFNPGLTTYATAGWNNTSYSSWTWDDELHETCPEGYRRPNIRQKSDGVAGNEALQSFVSTKASPSANSAGGYYADGYFDRLQVEFAGGTSANTTNASVVAKGGKDAAYIGRIIFNNSQSSDHYNASLFVPAAGYRNTSSGALGNAGSYGYSWSRLVISSGSNGCNFYVASGGLDPCFDSYKSYGFTVRCVVAE